LYNPIFKQFTRAIGFGCCCVHYTYAFFISNLSGCYKHGCFDSEHSEESYSLAEAHNVIPKQSEESIRSKVFDRLKFNSQTQQFKELVYGG
jgi:hypothetical protein